MSGYEFNTVPGVKQALLNDIFTIIYSSGVDIAGAGGSYLPTIERGIVVFNGSKLNNEAGQDFQLTGNNVEYIETDGAPYDVVVGTVLLRAAVYYPNVLMDYENINDSKWDSALNLYEALFGEWVPFAGNYIISAEDAAVTELWKIAEDNQSSQFYYDDTDFLSDYESFAQSSSDTVVTPSPAESEQKYIVSDLAAFRERKKNRGLL